ncbi:MULTISPECIES: glutamine amidotransferase [unclassified Streptomyces]|uniref:type 1 glutamine amidotransferase n=1 Tax=unclassified Streptomyces TaxID=2593676 RepID=UPI0029AA57FB|nr:MULTISPECIES: glutamine amidotransferase [unclassified Streptomyces]MDX3767889.1 glutamine amidotransferase [Streptomyces sp. AK08-01B]MDX3818116.1 glutamine amidotransferase [Streptomyces sp. AK08-01A]
MLPNTLTVVWIYPDLLSTYGDQGNVTALATRARQRGIAVDVIQIRSGQPIPALADIYVLGGGEDRAQALAAERLRGDTGLRRAVSSDRVVMGVCAGYQLLGTRFAGHDGKPIAGLGLLDVRSDRAYERAVGELLAVADPALGLPLITGFENHFGTTALGASARSLAQAVIGSGNGDGSEGAYQNHIIGTYLHGPVLVRNPALTDLLLAWATGRPMAPLDDTWTDRLRSERLRHHGHGENDRREALEGSL